MGGLKRAASKWLSAKQQEASTKYGLSSTKPVLLEPGIRVQDETSDADLSGLTINDDDTREQQQKQQQQQKHHIKIAAPIATRSSSLRGERLYRVATQKPLMVEVARDRHQGQRALLIGDEEQTLEEAEDRRVKRSEQNAQQVVEVRACGPRIRYRTE